MLALLWILGLPALAPQDSAIRSASDPAYAPDGRLVVSLHGDLWVFQPSPPGRWIQLTSGPAIDREPAWWPDGSAVVFSSNREGNFDLWYLPVGAEGARGEPRRLTTDPEWEGEPTVSQAGEVVFVRGPEPASRLVLRTTAGAESLLTTAPPVARWPTFAPSSRRLAYVTQTARGTALRMLWLDQGRASTVLEGRPIEHLAWSPQGDRLSFATRTGDAGTWVADSGGAYVNLVSRQPAATAWSPDGHTLALASLPSADPAYNGDPDRLGRRELIEPRRDDGRLWFIAVPPAPDEPASRDLAPPPPPLDRPALYGAAFDRMWQRTAKLYFAGPADADRYARWEVRATSRRPEALAAPDDERFERVLYQLWQERPPLRRPAAGRAAISSAHPLATAAGLAILRQGGNVVDAAVAISFVLGVVEPDASGIGGYGQMLVHLGSMAEPTVIEFMTRAPEEAGLSNAALLEGGRLPPDGPVLANVPGTVAGMYLAWRRFGSGRLPWAALLAPAIRLAREGFPVSDGLATTLSREREHLARYEGSRALFFRNGRPLQAGDILRNEDLARTLQAIADSGPAALYGGPLGRRMVEDLRGRGNAIRLADLSRYYAVERTPVRGTYRGYTVYSSAPPSAGGATLVAQLNLLEQFGSLGPYTDDVETLHAMIEAWKLVPLTRGRIADPGLWSVSLDAFVSKDSARARWTCFRPDRALGAGDLEGDPPACARRAAPPGRTDPGRPGEELGEVPDGDACGGEGPGHCHRDGTTAFVVGDAEGNVVAVTQTLGTWGGNFYVTPGLGFLYNDKLGSYPAEPGQYGARLPNARHGSSLAPTLVFRGTGEDRRWVLAVGAAGNAWITAAVYAIVTGVVDLGLDVQRAMELPRFLVSRGPGLAQRPSLGPGSGLVVEVEAGLAPQVLRGLRERGHVVEVVSLPGEVRLGYAAAVVRGSGGVVIAGADPRRAGAAGAIGCGEGEARGSDCTRGEYAR